jgi:hypothetical protein
MRARSTQMYNDVMHKGNAEVVALGAALALLV